MRTARVTGGNGDVAGRRWTTSSIDRFQKIVRAVAVQSRSPVSTSVASPTSAASSHAGGAVPSRHLLLVRRLVGDPAGGVRRRGGEPDREDGGGDPRQPPREEQHERARGDRATDERDARPAVGASAASIAEVGALTSVPGEASSSIGTATAASDEGRADHDERDARPGRAA